jgi:hypothetical protein
MSKLLKRRIDRLEVRVGMEGFNSLTDEAMLSKAASLLCGILLPNLRELQAEQTDPRHRHALSNQQQFALAIVSAENEAIDALLNVRDDGAWREAETMEEVLGKTYEEWQRIREARSAGGYSIGSRAPGWLEE